jgi:hypothetical protein
VTAVVASDISVSDAGYLKRIDYGSPLVGSRTKGGDKPLPYETKRRNNALRKSSENMDEREIS